MGKLVVALAGAGVGAYFGYPGLGFGIGGFIGGALFPGDPAKGPRLADLSAPDLQEGAIIPRVFGTYRVAGTPIWKTDLIERTSTSGGKGGGPEVETASYFGRWAVALCEGPIDGVLRIWANNKLIYDVRDTNTGKIEKFPDVITIYLGDETQEPDPLIESIEGVGQVEAYRGTAYLVLDELPLADTGNALANISAEVVRVGTPAAPQVNLGITGTNALLWSGGKKTVTYQDGGGVIQVYDQVTSALLRSATLSNLGAMVSDADGFLYAQDGDPGGTTASRVAVVDPDSLTIVDHFGQDLGFHVDDWGVVANAARMNIQDFEPGPFLAGGWQAGDLAETPDGKYRVMTITNVAADGQIGVWDVANRGGINMLATTLNAGGLFTRQPLGFCTTGGIVCELQRDSTDTDNRIKQFRPTKPKALQDDNSLEQISSTELTAATGGGEIGAIYVPETNSALIFGGDADNVVAFSLDTLTVTGTITAPGGIKLDNATNGTTQKAVASQRGLAGGKLWLYGGQGDEALIWEIDPVKFELIRTIDVDALYVLNGIGDPAGGIYDPTSHSMWIGKTGHGGAHIFLDRLTDQSMGLDQAVAEVKGLAGLGAGDIDVTSLVGDLVDMGVGNDAVAREILQQLGLVYFFDGVESDGKVKSVKRGGASVVTIPETELGARDAGAAAVDTLVETREPDEAIPRSVKLKHAERDRDYEPGLALAAREGATTQGATDLTVEVPIVFTATNGRRVAERLLYGAWLGRSGYQLSTLPRHRRLDPTDVFTAQAEGRNFAMRAEVMDYGGGGAVAIQARKDDASVYTSTLIGGANAAPGQEISDLDATTLYLMDLPLLLDTDSDSGDYYWAMTAAGNWPGAGLFRSAAGIEFDRIEDMFDRAVAGRASSVLASGPTTVFDNINTVDVVLLNGVLANATKLDVLNGANAALLGDEIFQFMTAVQLSTVEWRLSGLLRGGRGTEHEVGNHAFGERFVLLETVTVRSQPDPNVGIGRFYKGVTHGTLEEDAPAAAFTNTNKRARPLSVADLKAADSAGDVVITWKRRTRKFGEWRDFLDVPMLEATESYEVDIRVNGGAVARTLAVGVEAATYTAAQQATDGVVSTDVLTFETYQISATFGRGVVRSIAHTVP